MQQKYRFTSWTRSFEYRIAKILLTWYHLLNKWCDTINFRSGPKRRKIFCCQKQTLKYVIWYHEVLLKVPILLEEKSYAIQVSTSATILDTMSAFNQQWEYWSLSFIYFLNGNKMAYYFYCMSSALTSYSTSQKCCQIKFLKMLL